MPQYVIVYLGGDQPSSPEEGKQHFAKYKEWLSSHLTLYQEKLTDRLQSSRVVCDHKQPYLEETNVGQPPVSYLV